MYHWRSLVESIFSPIKERFGAVVAAKTLPLQELELILRSLCYNWVSERSKRDAEERFL